MERCGERCRICAAPECIGYDRCPICWMEYAHTSKRRMEEWALERAREMRVRKIKTWYAMDRNRP